MLCRLSSSESVLGNTSASGMPTSASVLVPTSAERDLAIHDVCSRRSKNRNTWERSHPSPLSQKANKDSDSPLRGQWPPLNPKERGPISAAQSKPPSLISAAQSEPRKLGMANGSRHLQLGQLQQANISGPRERELCYQQAAWSWHLQPHQLEPALMAAPFGAGTFEPPIWSRHIAAPKSQGSQEPTSSRGTSTLRCEVHCLNSVIKTIWLSSPMEEVLTLTIESASNEDG